MQGAVSSHRARILAGRYNLSQYVRRLSPAGAQDCLPSTTLTDDHHTYQLGLKSGVMALEGFYRRNDVTGTLEDVFAGLPQTGIIVTGFPEGFTAGNRAYLLLASDRSYTADTVINDLIKTSIQMSSQKGALEPGLSLHDLIAETGTGNGPTVDRLAGTTNGGVANLHVTAIAGAAPSVTIKIQHSTNGSTWADLDTFTVITGLTEERREIAPGTTVNRFVRYVVTFGGTTTSITFNLSFAGR